MRVEVMQHYGLTLPFNPAGYYETEHHRQLLKNIRGAILEGRLIALYGVIGSGKTVTLRRLQQQLTTVRICVHCRNWRGRRNRHGHQTLVYASWGLSPMTTTHWVYQVYRQRFGIETSYRQLHEARIKTSTRDPLLRLLFVGIALLLRNVWVWVHWHCLSTPRRGGRQLNLHSLRFTTLLIWLVHLAEQTFGINDSVVVRRQP